MDTKQTQAQLNAVKKSKALLDAKKAEKKSQARLDMEAAATTLARCEIGEGFPSGTVEAALIVIRDWKVKFVNYIIGKPNYQIKGTTHTRETAIALADNTFLQFYHAETAALKEPGLSLYWTREAGSVEFGKNMIEEATAPRMFSHFEECGGPEYKADEEDYSLRQLFTQTPWCGEVEDFISDDEVTESDALDQVIDPLFSTWEQKTEKLNELIVDLFKVGVSGRGKLLARARDCARFRTITWSMYSTLKSYAEIIAPVKERNEMGDMF